MDPYRLAFYAVCAAAHERAFPPTVERACGVLAKHGWRRGRTLRLWPWGKLGAVLELQLHNDRELLHWMTERATLHQVLTLWFWSTMFLSEIGSMDANDSQYARAKRLIGLRPTRLRYLRALSRFQVEGD